MSISNTAGIPTRREIQSFSLLRLRYEELISISLILPYSSELIIRHTVIDAWVVRSLPACRHRVAPDFQSHTDPAECYDYPTDVFALPDSSADMQDCRFVLFG